MRVYVQTRARREMRPTVRRSLTVRLLGGGRPPSATADLNGSSSSGMLSQTPVNGRASHSGDAHQLTDFCSFFWSRAESKPEHILRRRVSFFRRSERIVRWLGIAI